MTDLTRTDLVSKKMTLSWSLETFAILVVSRKKNIDMVAIPLSKEAANLNHLTTLTGDGWLQFSL